MFYSLGILLGFVEESGESICLQHLWAQALSYHKRTSYLLISQSNLLGVACGYLGFCSSFTFYDRAISSSTPHQVCVGVVAISITSHRRPSPIITSKLAILIHLLIS